MIRFYSDKKKEIQGVAIAEILNPTHALTKQFLAENRILYKENMPCIEDIILYEDEKTAETAQEQEHTSKTANCAFSGEQVPIDLKRFTDSGINLVECPDCGRMRSLPPVKGVLRFKSHTRRKQQTPLTEKRWSATGKTDWDVVGE